MTVVKPESKWAKPFFILGLAFLFALVLTPFVRSKLVRPPKIYVDEGACPFECCTYRDWWVTKTTTLFEAPKGDRVIGLLGPGITVTAETGNVYVVPSRMKVVFAHESYFHDKYEVGETIYLLTNKGEGENMVWHHGAIARDDFMFLHDEITETDRRCSNPTEDCWARLEEDHQSEEVWWVRVRTKEGLVGWARVDDNFDNMDACG